MTGVICGRDNSGRMRPSSSPATWGARRSACGTTGGSPYTTCRKSAHTRGGPASRLSAALKSRPPPTPKTWHAGA